MAFEGEVFCVRWKTEVRQAPGQGSPLFYTARAGQLFKRLGLPVQLADGTHRIPVLPRGWIDADALEPFGEVLNRNRQRETDVVTVPSDGRIAAGEANEIHSMAGFEASSPEPCNWLEVLGDDRKAVEPSEKVLDRDGLRDIDTVTVPCVGRNGAGEPKEIQPMAGVQASSAEPCNWLEVLGDDRKAVEPSEKVLDRDGLRDIDTVTVPCVGRNGAGEPKEIQPMAGVQASSAERCNWLDLLADDRNIGRLRTTLAVQGSASATAGCVPSEQQERSWQPSSQRPIQLKPRCAGSSTPLLAITDGGSLWREPLTKVPLGRQVHLPGVLLSDAGLRQWCDTEGPHHLARLGPGPLDCMDLSHNNLSDQGADDAVSFLLWRGQQTKRLKLFHNGLLEPLALCRLLEDERCGVGAVDGIMELHLSHNQMNLSIVERLLTSVATRLYKEARPLRPPLWLRVEHNNLDSEAKDLLKEIDSGVKLCFECGIKIKGRRLGCNLAHCRYGADVHLVLTMKTIDTEESNEYLALFFFCLGRGLLALRVPSGLLAFWHDRAHGFRRRLRHCVARGVHRRRRARGRRLDLAVAAQRRRWQLWRQRLQPRFAAQAAAQDADRRRRPPRRGRVLTALRRTLARTLAFATRGARSGPTRCAIRGRRLPSAVGRLPRIAPPLSRRQMIAQRMSCKRARPAASCKDD